MKRLTHILCATALTLATQTFSQASSLLVSYTSAGGGGIEKFSLSPQTAGTVFDSENVAVRSVTTANNVAYWSSDTQVFADSLTDATGGGGKTLLPSIPFAGVTVTDLAVDVGTNSYLLGWNAPGYGWFVVQYSLAPNSTYTIFSNDTDVVHGLSVAGNNAYWAEGSSIYSEHLDGTGKALLQSFTLGAVSINDVAIDSAGQTYLIGATTPGLPPLIARYPLTPNASGTLFAFATSNVEALTLAGDRAYWIDGMSIWSEKLDGTDLTLQETLAAGLTPTDLAVTLDAPAGVPEPESSVTLGSGLVMLSLLTRRRRKL